MAARDAWENADQVLEGARAKGAALSHEYYVSQRETLGEQPALQPRQIGTLPVQRTVELVLDGPET